MAEQLIFNPANQKQEDFVSSIKRQLLYSGAVGAGKSFAGCIKGFMLGFMYPGNRGLICRKENSTLTGSTLITLRKLIPPSMIVYENKKEGVIKHKTRIPGLTSDIIYGGLDRSATGSYPTKIGSTEFGWIFFDECTEGDKGDWDMLGTRLRWQIPYLTKEQNDRIPRQLFGATNPDGPYHHLHKTFFEDPIKNPKFKKNRDVFMTTPYENRQNLPTGYIEAMEESLEGLTRDRLLFGKWSQAEGLIYKEFSHDKHIIADADLLDFNDYQHFLFGADANFAKPRAALIIGVRSDGVYDVICMFYKRYTEVEELREWADYKAAHVFNREIDGYHDPADPQAIVKLNHSSYLRVEKANNKVLPGIQTVQSLFKNNRIRIHQDCFELIKELNNYRWKKGQEDSKPEKDNDHAMDALRYALYSDIPEGDPALGQFTTD